MAAVEISKLYQLARFDIYDFADGRGEWVGKHQNYVIWASDPRLDHGTIMAGLLLEFSPILDQPLVVGQPISGEPDSGSGGAQ